MPRCTEQPRTAGRRQVGSLTGNQAPGCRAGAVVAARWAVRVARWHGIAAGDVDRFHVMVLASARRRSFSTRRPVIVELLKLRGRHACQLAV